MISDIQVLTRIALYVQLPRHWVDFKIVERLALAGNNAQCDACYLQSLCEIKINPIGEQALHSLSRSVIPQRNNKPKDFWNWSTWSLNDFHNNAVSWRVPNNRDRERQREREGERCSCCEKHENFWVAGFCIFHKKTDKTCVNGFAVRDDLIVFWTFLNGNDSTINPVPLPFSLNVTESWMLTSVWSPARAFFNLLCHIHFMQAGSRTAHQFWCLTAHHAFSWVYVERWAPSIFFLRFYMTLFLRMGNPQRQQTGNREICRIEGKKRATKARHSVADWFSCKASNWLQGSMEVWKALLFDLEQTSSYTNPEPTCLPPVYWHSGPKSGWTVRRACLRGVGMHQRVLQISDNSQNGYWFEAGREWDLALALIRPPGWDW